MKQLKSILTGVLIGLIISVGLGYSSKMQDLVVCKVLKTGQITSYVDYDDGYYQKGIAKSYTVLTTGQFSGTTNITINSKTDVHSNNCVLDNNTGLMWSRYVSASVGPASDGKIPWTTTGAGETAEGIFPYCAAANTALLGGYGDWRVCNVGEIFSLLNLELNPVGPNAVTFPSFPATVWTSTTWKNTTTRAWFIQDVYPTLIANQTKITTDFVLLVRGGG